MAKTKSTKSKPARKRDPYAGIPKDERKTAGNRLRTQKDGRLFAIDLLEKVDALALRDERFSAERGSRKGPQDDMILRAFERVMYFGKSQAILGFFCVITDKIGISSRTPGSSYRRWEGAGKLQHWRLQRHDLSKQKAEAAEQ